jgi:hypothetical protein
MAGSRKNEADTAVAHKANKVRLVHDSKQGGDRGGLAAALKALGEIK